MSKATEIYRPAAVIGKFYGRVRNTEMPFIEMGNWTEASFEQDLDEDRKPDMTVLGGGTHSKLSRIKGVTLSAKTVDLNVTTLARHLRATIGTQAAGNVTGQTIKVYPGGLTPLPHISASAVVLKNGATTIPAAGNYEVRPEGLFVLPTSTAITAATDCTIDYAYPEQVSMEPLTTAAAELEILFAGLNEADSGKPQVLKVHRASADLIKKLPLLSDKLMDLDLSFEILTDPSKTGVGKSRFYKLDFA